MTKHDEALREIICICDFESTGSCDDHCLNIYWCKKKIQQIRDAGFIHKSEIKLDEGKIGKILKKTQIGIYYPIKEKWIPLPKPKPLYLHDYKIDLGRIIKLAHAIAQAKNIIK